MHEGLRPPLYSKPLGKMHNPIILHLSLICALSQGVWSKRVQRETLAHALDGCQLLSAYVSG
jgi:hypothetical protein